MGFDTMRSFQQLSLYSSLRSPIFDDDENLRRQDSFISNDPHQRRHISKERSPTRSHPSPTMSRNAKPASVEVEAPSFQATKAKWSPPPSPTSATASPVSPRPSAIRFDSASSTSSRASNLTPKEKNELAAHLFSSACSGDLAGIEILLNQGASINSSVLVGGLFEAFTPAKAGHLSPLAGAASYGQCEAVELLLARGAELNPSNSKSASSPLHQAIRSNNYKLVQLLLERGADIDIENAYKTTPIMYAVKYQQSLDIVSLLLTYQPDLNKVSFINTAAIHGSIWPGNVKVTELLLSAGADPNHPMNDGNTPLHCAVMANNLHMVRCLLRHGADPVRRNCNWESPMCLAEAQPEEHAEILQLLKASMAQRK